jgi:hypothetical protein
MAIEQDLTARGDQKLGQQIEDRGFACAIGADQGVNLAALNVQVHAIDGNKTFELFDQFIGF